MGVNERSDAMIKIMQKENISRFAEIGVWKGHLMRKILRSYSDIPFLNEYWAIDQWDIMGEEHGRMGKLTYEDWTEKYRRCCEDMYWFKKLRVVRLTSKKAVTLFPKGYFDMVFIDASHFYEDVHEDIGLWLPMVRKGGILSGHDYNNVRFPGVKKAVDEAFGEENIERSVDKTWFHYV